MYQVYLINKVGEVEYKDWSYCQLNAKMIAVRCLTQISDFHIAVINKDEDMRNILTIVRLPDKNFMFIYPNGEMKMVPK